MAYEFKFPDVGEGIQEGILKEWQVKPGDAVKVDQTLCSVETDKAVVDMPSPVAGKVQKTFHKEGETIKVGEILAVIGDDDDAERKESSTSKKDKTEEKPSESKRQKKDSHTKEDAAEEEKPYTGSVVGHLEEATSGSVVPKEIKTVHKNIGGVKATLLVRKLAEALSVDINAVTGTGPDGRITEKDVKKAAGNTSTESEPKKSPVNDNKKGLKGIAGKKKYDMWGFVDRVPYKGIRKTIADKMVKSHMENSPVTYHVDVNMDALVKVREKEKKRAEKKGVKLTYLAYIIKALILAGEKFPLVNSEIQGDDIIVKKYFNVGIAVDTDNGLMAPVVKRAENKSVIEIAKEVIELAGKAQKGKLDMMDMKGGSITVSNIGSIGVDYFTPVINPPEASILGLGRMADKPVIKNGRNSVGKIMPISFTADHRIIDGAYAARFLNELKMILEEGKLK